MVRAVLGVFVVGLLGLAVWLSGDKRQQPPAASWEKVHVGWNFAVYRANTSPVAYLIAANGEGLLIDNPAGLPKPPVPIRQVLLTHHHRDSCEGTFATPPRILAPKASAEWLEPNRVPQFWKESLPLRGSRTGYFVHPTGIAGIEFTLAHGQTLDWHGLKIEVLGTPGHSPDHVSFVLGELVLLGDALTGDGKLWTPFTTDWDHWQDVGLKPAAQSLRMLAERNPAKLFPARGPVVEVNVASRLQDAAKAIDEAGFLKSFTRFTDRVGNPPQYEYLVPAQQPGSNGTLPWAKVSPSLWITGNTYVLKSNRSNGILVLDPWADRIVGQIEQLRQAEKLGPVEAVVFSHAHFDHFDGVYNLPVQGNYQVWALDTVAEPIEQPFRYRAPFLDARPIRFNRKPKDGETIAWQEYQLKFHHFPGQSYFTAAMECNIDGKRCLFTADNFFHQKLYSGSGGWMGLNRSSPLMYAESARKVLAINPEWILAEHGGPFVFHPEDFRRRVAWGEAAGRACDAISPNRDHRLDWSPHSVSVSPCRVTAKPGSDISFELAASRFPFAVDVVVASKWAGEKRFQIPTQAGNSASPTTVRLRVPPDAVPGRVVIPILARGPLGEVADPFFAVDIERE